MSILYVYRDEFDISLHRIRALEMMKELKMLGHNVTLFTSYSKKKLNFGLGNNLKYIPIINIKGFRALSFWVFSYPKILWHIISRQPNAVIFDIWACWCGFPFDIFCKMGLVKTKFIVDVRTFNYCIDSDTCSIKDFLIKLYTHLGLTYNKHIHRGLTVITEELKRQIREKHKIAERFICVWSSGVSLKKFKPGLKKSIPNVEGKFVVMQHGGLSYNRGLLEIIMALDLLKNCYRNIILFILGSGPAEKLLKNTIENLGLQERCVLHHPVEHSEIPGYLANCNVGIMAYPRLKYWQVNSPIKLLEYLAMNKPVIVTDMPMFRNVIGSQKCGIYITCNSPSNIAQAIVNCFENKERLSKWGKTGRQIIEQRYTWQQQAKILSDFIEHI